MWARRVRSSRRNSHGVASIRRDTYNTNSGMSIKAGWWPIRDKVWQRDGGRCQAIFNGVRCLKPGKEVHHIISLSDGGTTTMANLITLCLGCHDRRHRHLFRARSK
jgi:5-methylcytosine-specific restriction endonuclease McrA